MVDGPVRVISGFLYRAGLEYSTPTNHVVDFLIFSHISLLPSAPVTGNIVGPRPELSLTPLTPLKLLPLSNGYTHVPHPLVPRVPMSVVPRPAQIMTSPSPPVPETWVVFPTSDTDYPRPRTVRTLVGFRWDVPA